MDEQYLSPEDLYSLRNGKAKTLITALQAEKAILENKLAEAEYKGLVLSLCVKYKATEASSIEEATGKIFVKKKEEQ